MANKKERKERFEQLKVLGYDMLTDEEKQEYDELKPDAMEEDLKKEKESTMAEIKAAPDDEEIKMSDVKILIAEINKLKELIGEKDAVIKNHSTVAGIWQEVVKQPDQRTGRFRKWRENTDEAFKWIVGYRWFQKKWDNEMKQWDNFYYLTLLAEDGSTSEKLITDHLWSKIKDVDELRMTDIEQKDESYIHPSTPTVKKKKLVEDSTRVSGYRLEILGDVPATITRKTISYNVHFTKDLALRLQEKFINM